MAQLVINSIQRGSTTLSTTDTTKNQTITAVTLANSILRVIGVKWDSGITNGEPRRICVSGRLSSTTNIYFTRATSGAQVTVQWEVISYSSGITVETVSRINTWGGDPQNITITSVDTSKSFPIVSFAGDQGSTQPAAQVRLSSSTNIQLNTPNNYWGGEITIQVVTIDDASVQLVTGNLDTDAQTDVTISTVDMSKTFLECTWMESATTDLFGYNIVNHILTSTTNVQFNRQRTSGAPAAYYAVHAISIGGTSNIKIQRGTSSFGASATVSPSIISVNLNKTQLHLTQNSGALQCSATGTPPSVESNANGVITNSTTLTFTKGGTTNRAEYITWEVIEEISSGTVVIITNSRSILRGVCHGIMRGMY